MNLFGHIATPIRGLFIFTHIMSKSTNEHSWSLIRGTAHEKYLSTVHECSWVILTFFVFKKCRSWNMQRWWKRSWALTMRAHERFSWVLISDFISAYELDVPIQHLCQILKNSYKSIWLIIQFSENYQFLNLHSIIYYADLFEQNQFAGWVEVNGAVSCSWLLFLVVMTWCRLYSVDSKLADNGWIGRCNFRS